MLSPFERLPTAKNFTVGATKYNSILYNGMYAEWLKDTGREPFEDLSNKLAVQLGSFTEEFNALWFEKQTGIEFADMTIWQKPYRDKQEIEFQHRLYPWLNTHPDKVYIDPITAEVVLVDCKHTNERNYEIFAEAKFIERYEPQLQMQMFAGSSTLGVEIKKAELSVIYGNSKWNRLEIKADKDRQLEIFKVLQEYVSHVVNDTEPSDKPIEKLAPLDLEQMESLDWDESNENNTCRNSVAQWAVYKDQYLKTKAHHKEHDKVIKLMKSFMPENARRAGCNEITMTRTRANHIIIKERKPKVKHG